MRRFSTPLFIGSLALAALTSAHAAELPLGESNDNFTFKDKTGRTHSASVVRHYWRVPIVHPYAKIDPRLDGSCTRAASFAQERANARSKGRCWHFVKEALVAAHVISSYPKTAYAFQAGDELVRDYGFRKLAGVRDPYQAPVGAVLVYSHGSSGYGHVEIRTKNGFVSDYFSKNRCKYPLIAAYAKFDS